MKTLMIYGVLTRYRETMRQLLNFPNTTRIEFKSHDSSLLQRAAIDEQRREKANQHHTEKRQATGGSRPSQE